ncbi:DUF4087 domain-containing protein [Bordetella sp. FB-8]|uniref:DUF4087 domain-containing protein n=1 Tax=Bordetella sp. FB-8 TaxID=1159870 RepID=UPI0012DBF5EE|nr:DUF4087 domain-containing protein [Bordetella sp. FB-8]
MNTAGMLLGGMCAALLAGAAYAGSPTQKDQLRCGWWDNPTPQNVSLFDRDGQWLVSVQGGHQAEGDWPDFKDSQWVNTNGHYGYGCACLNVAVDLRSHEVVRIRAAHARPLSVCRRDPALKGVRP